MSLAIHLLGRPYLERDGHAVAAPRGHKAWGLIAYLVLSRVRNPSREHLAELLFAAADDPLGSLRWNLAELRRALGAATLPHGSTALSLAPGTFVDVDALVRATPQEAVAIPGLGREVLEGMEFGNSPAFETWLLIERRRLLGASEAALHEAALDRLAAGEAAPAVGRFGGGVWREAANRQVSACLELFRAERGTAPGPAVFRAAEARPPAPLPAAGPSGVQAARARLEAGDSAISAGSFEPGVRSLARAAAEAKACGAHELEAECWLTLGTALVHSARGRDEEGADALLRASALAEEHGLGDVAAGAYRELGYVDILQARYARCAQRLERAATLAESDEERAGVEAMLGLAAADTGAHERALAHLRHSAELAERTGSHQQAAFSLSFVGRSHFLREETDEARAALERSLAIAREIRWVAFEPWPESWLAEADLAAGHLPEGRERFEHAWALASELGDPCWEGAAGQGLGRVACKEGRVSTGIRLLEDSRRRAASFPDAYVWVEAYALAELAIAAVEAGHRRARQWVEDLISLTARTGMRELAVRAYLLRADLGDGSALESAQILAAEVENPALQRRIRDLLAAVAV
jgi:tetratricopeptide (TPR) repeat protein